MRVEGMAGEMVQNNIYLHLLNIFSPFKIYIIILKYNHSRSSL